MAAKLSARDHQIAALLASGLTYRECGDRLKLSERTIRRAMERPQVRAEVDAIRARAVEAGLGLLCEGFTKAVKELNRLVTEATPQDAVRLGAVKEAIDSLLKVRGQVTLERRLEALERAHDELGGPGEGAGKEDGCPPGNPGGCGESGSAPARPDGGTHEGGNEARSVAAEPSGGPVDTGIAFSFPASGQE